MSGYSDGFSYLSNGSDAQKKSFAFLSENNISIYAPDEKSFGDGDSKKTGSVKTELDSNFEQYMNQRKYEVPNAPNRL